MARPTNRWTEEIGVGFYLIISLFGAIAYLGVQVSNGPFIGGSYLVIAVFWLCVCASVATALVVLLVNGYRALQDTTADWVAVGFAALVLASIAGALFLAFLTNRLQTAMVVGVVGLIIAPLGLLASVFKLDSASYSARIAPDTRNVPLVWSVIPPFGRYKSQSCYVIYSMRRGKKYTALV